MTSVVSTVAGGMETPDFLELRKGRTVTEAVDSGPKSLYQVLPEKQTSVRGLMGSERGYDVSGVAGAPIPVLGEERGTKVRILHYPFHASLTLFFSARTVSTFLSTPQSWRASRRKSSVGNTIRTRVAMLAFRVRIVFPTELFLREARQL